MSQTVIDSSKITDYLTCPRMFFFRHILGWNSQSKNLHLTFGTLWHEALEFLLLHGYTEDNIILAMQKFSTHYFESFTEEQALENAPKNPDWAEKMLRIYIKQFQRDLSENTVEGTELGGYVPIGAKEAIAFKLDAILLAKDKSSVFVLEHKTASREMNTWFDEWNARFQLATYYYVLSALYPELSNRSIVVNVGLFRKTSPEFKRLRIVKTKEQMLSWLWLTNQVLLSINAERDLFMNGSYENKPVLTCFPQNPTNCIQYAHRCNYFDICHTWANPIAVFGTEPPDGYSKQFWNPLEMVQTDITFKVKRSKDEDSKLAE